MSGSSILAGSNDVTLLQKLYLLLDPPQNEPQEQFRVAWEVADFIAGDGFEWLFEQENTLEEFERIFVGVGFHQAAPYIRRAAGLVPNHLLLPENEGQLFPHIHAEFDSFKRLLYEYLEVAEPHLFPALGEFVRANRAEFAAPLSRLSQEPKAS